MIRTFADAETERFFTSGQSRRLPVEILKRAVMRLTQLDAAVQVEDLRLPVAGLFRFDSGDAFNAEIVDDH